MRLRGFYWWAGNLMVFMVGVLAGMIIMAFALGWALTDVYSIMIQEGQ